MATGKVLLDADRTAPSSDLQPVTPDDNNDLPNGPCRGLRIGTAGNVAIITHAGTSVVLKNSQDGQTEPHGCRRVLSTGTTAADILAAY